MVLMHCIFVPPPQADLLFSPARKSLSQIALHELPFLMTPTHLIKGQAKIYMYSLTMRREPKEVRGGAT